MKLVSHSFLPPPRELPSVLSHPSRSGRGRRFSPCSRKDGSEVLSATRPQEVLPMEADDYPRGGAPPPGECAGIGNPLRCASKIYPDPDAEVAIMGSVVYCIHYKEGCKWSDELRKLQGHLNMCKFDAIPCTNHCGAMIPRLVMDDHRLYTCPKRLTRCEYCAREFTGEALEGHVGSCQLEPIYCENKCGSKIQRRHQNQHRQQECTKRLVPCRYCQKEFVYDTLQIHTAKCPRLPVSCPNRCDVLKIAKEDLETHLSDHCTALTLSCTFKDMGCKFKGTRSALDQHLEDGTKPHLLLVCGVVSRQQHHINALRTAMQGLNLNTSGTLLWRITDYSRRLLEAREGYELCSTPFTPASTVTS
ncbi:TNF receptor-associated factor 4 [Caerostris extrusa]|uniref:TNF receptor-associated factor 4 n=1 Tax=Caerostris extrusa TaxID=172846 RepID=A0AAV4WA01_CAEEX|nr:TNF receptor-associated factor 4 [Caerostris extrusa]